MAFSAHKDADALKEHFEDAATLDHKTDVLVKMIKDSKHFVVFTGAGVSTSAGIPGTIHAPRPPPRQHLLIMTRSVAFLCFPCTSLGIYSIKPLSYR